ncbi:fimbrial protein [Providencia manganoxydans]|uniref:fimbrial protein n=1 Tax=Providencia manganoxydans TaxID=2923283 RepID=UPI00280D3FE6|nr:fimbrial protein [Providencia stuartii]ELR5082278.1 fimbrial protein [Providencia stuartii]
MLKKTVFALSMITLSGTALSTPVANLKVTGSITPPTCTINSQDEITNTYDFDISPGIFPASGDLTLEAESQPITVTCDATTYLTFDATDQRDGTASVPGDKNFGLNKYNTDNVGYYTITMENAKVQANENAAVKDVGVLIGASYASSGVVDKTQKTAWATSSAVLAQGQIFSADFTVTPTIDSKMKNSAGDAKLDGYAVLAFGFGL